MHVPFACIYIPSPLPPLFPGKILYETLLAVVKQLWWVVCGEDIKPQVFPAAFDPLHPDQICRCPLHQMWLWWNLWIATLLILILFIIVVSHNELKLARNSGLELHAGLLMWGFTETETSLHCTSLINGAQEIYCDSSSLVANSHWLVKSICTCKMWLRSSWQAIHVVPPKMGGHKIWWSCPVALP